MKYIYDGTYAGLLSAVFESFERKHFAVSLTAKELYAESLFFETLEIYTDTKKATRVTQGLKKHLTAAGVYDMYKVFLSEDDKARDALFYIIQQIFLGTKNILENFGDERVLLFDKTLTRVNRERHRMKAFIRFQKSNEGMYYALVEPDFNVLPLVVEFFKNRYADQSWLLYDLKRNYGLMYDTRQVTEVQLDKPDENSLSIQTSEITLDEKELHYQNLWKQYFKSTNIVARKNMKLHLQHVPRRYWKYLVEKQA